MMGCDLLLRSCGWVPAPFSFFFFLSFFDFVRACRLALVWCSFLPFFLFFRLFHTVWSRQVPLSPAYTPLAQSIFPGTSLAMLRPASIHSFLFSGWFIFCWARWHVRSHSLTTFLFFSFLFFSCLLAGSYPSGHTHVVGTGAPLTTYSLTHSFIHSFSLLFFWTGSFILSGPFLIWWAGLLTIDRVRIRSLMLRRRRRRL